MAMNDSFLMCDEELSFTSPSPSPLPSREKRLRHVGNMESPPLCAVDADEDELEEAFKDFRRRELHYKPTHGYAEQLRNSPALSSARAKAVRWIISACVRHNLSCETASTAANCLDRFISKNCSIKWESWMMELLSISCLSIASKMEEVTVALVHELQTEDLDHLFQSSTIQRMELTVLKALNWRLTSVTPYSYVHLLARQLDSPDHITILVGRTTELLLRSLQETELVEHSACAVAFSALKCSICELGLHTSDVLLSVLASLIPKELMTEVDTCKDMMEKLAVGRRPCSTPPARSWERGCCFISSPVTSIPMGRTEVLDCHVDIDGCFSRGATGPESDTNKRKWLA